MTPVELGRIGVSVALTGTLLWAAISDIRWRKIPNPAVLAVLVLYAVWASLNPPAIITGALLVALVAFIGLYLLYAFGVMGAGDVKLFAAVALFAGAAFIGPFAMATALSGGLMAVVVLASRPARAMAMFQLRGRGDWGRGIPYGCAIAAGGILMQWGQILGMLTPHTLFGLDGLLG